MTERLKMNEYIRRKKENIFKGKTAKTVLHRDMEIWEKRTATTASSRFMKFPADMCKFQKRLYLYGSSRFQALPLRQ